MDQLTTFDRPHIEQFARDWEAAFDRGDYRAMATFYAADAVLIGTEVETQEGRDAIEGFWKTACDGAKRIALRRRVEVLDSARDGNLGYVRGTVFLDAPGRFEAVRVRYLTLWRRAAGGAWQLSVDISTMAPTRTAPA
jgi:uncharacterized protein (TIGR02246 family)